MLEAGNPVTVVCDRHGISESTFHLWKQKSDEAEEAEDRASPFFGFSERVRASQAIAEEKALKIVWDAAVGGRKVTKTVVKRKALVQDEPDPDWGPGSERRRLVMETDRTLLEEETTVTTYQTLPNPSLARWFLERRNRKDWGNSLSLTGEGGKGPIRYRDEGKLDLGKLSDDELDHLEKLYEKAEAGAGAADEPGADQG
ncbi:hypothetical protein DAETH_48270 (plasmid) [Deinococcus aetherius]|uniref:Transposase n=2 Tax=Deinococcus aetherius TaxID=200252 RepID=A0ABN6RSA2_9DEIO|nr:hypothetical protein DAETH_48270 [Deinococcus aetherius]